MADLGFHLKTTKLWALLVVIGFKKS